MSLLAELPVQPLRSSIVATMDGQTLGTSFDAPPVAEVAVGVQFAAVPGLGGLRGGSLWRSWSDEYSELLEQPPLPPLAPLGQSDVWFQFGGPFGTRTWFVDSSQDHIIQIQNDRLIVNWRRVSGADYPRFPEVRRRFELAWSDVQALTADLTGAPAAVDQLEVSYINNIAAAPQKALVAFDNILGSDDGFTQVAATFTKDAASPDWGKAVLTIGINSVAAPSEALSVTLTVRAVPVVGASPLAAIDRAHELIVKTFSEITTASMQVEWRRL
jgi:hypothetical protein